MTLSRGGREFLAEAEELLEELGEELLRISSPEQGAVVSPHLINAVFRGAHTLKGLAGMLGYTVISGLAHHLENLLDLIRLGRVPLDDRIRELLFASVDTLRELVRASGQDGLSPDISLLVAQLSACSARSAGPSLAHPERLLLPSRMSGALTEFEEHRLHETLRSGRRLSLVNASFLLESFDRELTALLALLRSQGEVISTLPSPGRRRPDAIDFQILMGSDAPLRALPAEVTWEAVAPPPSLPAAPERGVSARSISGMVRVDIGLLDELMAIVGELAATQSTLMAAVAELQRAAPTASVGVVKSAGRMGKKLAELQTGVMALRMVPLKSLYDKLTRIVKKIASEEGRELELLLFGAETRLDKQIIEDIADPLMHLVRNAVDHGIEPPAERLAKGKGGRGRITITAGQQGNRVVIEVADDGRGVDLARVRQRAVARGVVATPDELSDREALELIFEPGFSTSEVVSELSGRGVGMDVVKSNVTLLSGTVALESEPGRGSRVIVSLPITLAIIRTLLIEAGGERYGVPLAAIRETVAVAPGELLTHQGNELLRLREMTLPVIRLDRFFSLAGGESGESPGFALVAGGGARMAGILVDGIGSQQDLVLKPLGALLGGVRGVAGAAEIGDEQSILLLDLPGIIDEFYRGGNGRGPR